MSKTMLILIFGWITLLAIPAMAQDTGTDSEDISQTGTATPTTATSDLLVTTQIRMNVRQGPGTEYPVVGLMVFGDSYDITGRTGDGSWLRLNYNGGEGWVFRNLVIVEGNLENAPVAEAPELADTDGDAAPQPLLDAEATPEVVSNVVIRTVYNTNLRSSPSTEAEVVDVVPFNTQLFPAGRTADSRWVILIYEGQSGWAYAPILWFTNGVVRTLPVMTVLPAITPTPEATPGASSGD